MSHQSWTPPSPRAMTIIFSGRSYQDSFFTETSIGDQFHLDLQNFNKIWVISRWGDDIYFSMHFQFYHRNKGLIWTIFSTLLHLRSFWLIWYLHPSAINLSWFLDSRSNSISICIVFHLDRSYSYSHSEKIIS